MSQSEIWLLLLAHQFQLFLLLLFEGCIIENWKVTLKISALNAAPDDFEARIVLNGSVVKEFNWWLYKLDAKRHRNPSS